MRGDESIILCNGGGGGGRMLLNYNGRDEGNK
jgi:hypothetical protein